MESPEGRAPSATSSPDSTVRESLFLRFLSNLTPIKSEPCTQRVLETNLPATPLVFSSPQIDQQRGTQFLSRTETDAAGQNACQRFDSETNPLSLSWSGHDVQSSSPSGNADDYISEAVEVERANDMAQLPQGSTFTVTEAATGRVDDASYDTTREAGSTLGDEFGHDVPSKSSYLVKYLEERKSLSESSIMERHQANQASNQQQLHGIRRHLHFEAALALNSGTNFNRGSSSKMQVPVPSVLETRGLLTVKQDSHESLGHPSSSFQDEYMRCQQNGGSLAPLVPFPCFGVHLNNIASSDSVRSDELLRRQLVGHLSLQIESTMPQMDHCFPENLAPSPITRTRPILDNVLSADGQSQALVLGSSEPYGTKALAASMRCELQELPGDGRLDLTSADETEILSQNSAKGSKKRLTSSSKTEECKRCNCKRSKCLKLYCDCFAAGIYCVDSCACENCLNKPEYEDIVLDTRHQIEQRNPLAFAPKIVDTGSDSLVNVVENKNRSTPSSTRHKRGCNCKKSKCLKKYCECYQAKVGCSDGCRCEDCKNTFGMKQGFAEPVSQTKRTKYLSHKKFSAEATSDSIKNDTTSQLPPTYEESVDKTQGTQCSGLQSKALASSSSSNGRNHNQTAVESCKRNDGTPEMFKENRVPDDATEAGFPNQRDASETLSLNSFSQRRKNFILQSMPSFPPLTPYSNSKVGDAQVRKDHNGSNRS